MNVLINGFVHLSKRSHWDDANAPPNFTFFTFDASKTDSGYIMVGPASFEYGLPLDWNVVAAEVASLEEQKLTALAEYQKSMASINDRLSKLLALTNEVPGDATD